MKSFWNWRIFCAVALALLLQACASDGTPSAADATSATRTLRTTYEYIYENYYWGGRLDAVGMAGIRNLKSLEPRLLVTDDADRATLLLDDVAIHSFRKPYYGAADSWASVTRESIKALIAASPAVAEVTWIETVDAVLEGAAAALDRNAIYWSRSQQVALGLEHGGKAAAVGIALEHGDLKPDGSPPVIGQVRRNSTAERAGLRAGDSLMEVDGQPASSLGVLDLDLILFGAKNTILDLKVRRGAEGPTQEFSVAREVVDLEEPVIDRLDGLLYLQLTNVTMVSVEAVKKTLQAEVEKESGGASGLILDLRGTSSRNPWVLGFFMELFIDGETFFSMRGRDYRHSHRFTSRDKATAPDLPMVVLVNGGTNAASEAMAAGFGDTGRALVLGSATYGRGSVQTAPRLLNGGIMVFTTSYLFTRAGNAIENRGILPMVCTAGLASAAEGLAALRAGKGVIDPPTRNSEFSSASGAGIKAQRTLCPPQLGQEDVELELAVALLKDPALYQKLLAEDQAQQSAAN